LRIVICPHLSLEYLGGGEKWVLSVANDLVKRGHEVEIYSTPIKVAAGVHIDNLKELLNDIPYIEKMRHTIKADVCYIFYHPLFHLNFSTKSKRIIGIHATTCWEPLDFKYGFLPIQAQILHKIFGARELATVEAVHTVAPYLGIPNQNVYKIPNFVDSTIFIPQKKPDEFTVVYASRKSYQKGWDIFEKLKPRLERESIRVKVSGDIAEKDMPRFLAEAHVGIVPSRYDSFGLSIVEMIMSGLQVVTSPLESHRSLDLLMYLSQTEEAYLATIKYLKSQWESNPNKYNDFCDKSRALAITKYDRPIIMDRLENMFIEVGSK